MKVLLDDFCVTYDDGHGDLIQRLAEIYPEGLRNTYWSISSERPVEEGSELAKAIFATMEEFGMKRSSAENIQKFGRKMIFRVQKEIIYTHKDLSGFKLLRLDCHRLLKHGRKGEVLDRHDSHMSFWKDTIPDNVHCLYDNCANFIGPRVRERLSSSDIRGYILRPTLIKSRDEYKENPELWELATEYYIREYSRKAGEAECYDITLVESRIYENTDFAYLENRRINGWFFSDLICSQRFYQWWYANKFKHVKFIPCNIIEHASFASSAPPSAIPPPLPATQ